MKLSHWVFRFLGIFIYFIALWLTIDQIFFHKQKFSELSVVISIFGMLCFDFANLNKFERILNAIIASILIITGIIILWAAP